MVRAGLPEAEQGTPFLPGPVLAAPFHLQGEVASSDLVYTRYGNPTWSRYEAALAELEGGEVVLFASGMAAATALLLTSLQPGSAVAMDQDCYQGVRRLAEQHLEPRGVELRLARPDELVERAAGRRRCSGSSRPSNPKLEVYDLAALAEAARAAGALSVVDNTTAGPLLPEGARPRRWTSRSRARPSTWPATPTWCSATWPPATPSAPRPLRDWRTEAGSLPGPFEVWLAHRSLATLALRLERGSANALALAELLSASDDVEGVRYPGLPADPGHEIARRQMSGFGTVVAFDLGSRERAERFLAAAELVTEATSFGGVHTTAERRVRWGGDDVPEGFIRLSAGCEDTADLVADVERALARGVNRPLLVTGGSGYLGRELLRRAEAVGTSHSSPGDVRLDVRDAAAVAALFESLRPARGDPHGLPRRRPRHDLRRSRRTSRGRRRRCGARLVHISTDVVFDGEKGEPYAEEDEPTPRDRLRPRQGRRRAGGARGAPGGAGRAHVADLRRPPSRGRRSGWPSDPGRHLLHRRDALPDPCRRPGGRAARAGGSRRVGRAARGRRRPRSAAHEFARLLGGRAGSGPRPTRGVRA